MKVTKENYKQLEEALKEFYYQNEVDNEVDINFKDIINEATKKGYIDEWEYKREKETDDEYAYRQLKLICQVYNDGWESNWNNIREKKHYPWFSASSGFAFVLTNYYCGRTSTGSRLCFKSEKLAAIAGQKFNDIYKKYLLK